MTLSHFLTHTAAVPAPVLRQAMAAALSVEAPRTAASFARFYSRVVSELAVAAMD